MNTPPDPDDAAPPPPPEPAATPAPAEPAEAVETAEPAALPEPAQPAEPAHAPETAEAAESPVTAPARPRRGRWALRLLAGALALTLLLAAGALAAERHVRGQVDAVVRDALPGLSDDAEVTTQGVLLTQVLSGSLDVLDVSASSLHLEQEAEDGTTTALDLHGLSASLTDVGLGDPHPTRSLDASGTVTWQDLSVLVTDAAPRLSSVELTPAEYGTVTAPGTLTATSEVLGADGVLVVVPSLTEDGSLLMTVTEATVRGMTLDLADEDSFLMTLLGMETPEILVDREILPEGLSFSAVVVTDDGLRVSMSGSDLELATLGS